MIYTIQPGGLRALATSTEAYYHYIVRAWLRSLKDENVPAMLEEQRGAHSGFYMRLRGAAYASTLGAHIYPRLLWAALATRGASSGRRALIS